VGTGSIRFRLPAPERFMEKRVLLAVLLSFLVLYGYQAVFPPPKPRLPQARSTQAPSPRQSAPTPTTAAARDTSPVPAAAAPSEGPAPSGAAPLVGESAERTVTVDTSAVTAVFSNRGARILSWRLKHYLDDHGKPVDLVPAGLADRVPRPFTLRAEDPSVTTRLNDALYSANVGGQAVPDRLTITRPTDLTFEFHDVEGLQVRKAFHLDPRGYVLTFSTQVRNGAQVLNPVVQWGPGLGDSIHVAGQQSSFGSYVQKPQPILMKDGKVERLATPQQHPSHQGTFPFAGVDDHYFIAMAVEPGLVRVQYEPVVAPMPGNPALQRDMVAWEVLFARPPDHVRFFYGPKDYDVLASVDRTLVDAIYFGKLRDLAVPLLRALKWINRFVGNYGWSIIILTVLINLAMFPLRHKSVVSMRRMQELQPHIKAIQDRYAKYKATDPERQKMNQELMALYKEKGVNPASGCLPMVLTMPVLFAFYSLLSVAIEMRGAPFALWIKDLSVHDPYYITPLIMGATMFWQQRLTPVADPAQAKVMMLTPVMFLFFFLWAPSGLVIYWTVSNLLGIAQQYATTRIMGAPHVRHVRPPAERQLKSAGAGRSESARKA
jgi:YidC/Oxa1 family membrane protein insertase